MNTRIPFTCRYQVLTFAIVALVHTHVIRAHFFLSFSMNSLKVSCTHHVVPPASTLACVFGGQGHSASTQSHCPLGEV